MNEKNLKILKIQREKTSVHIYIYIRCAPIIETRFNKTM